MSDAKLAGVVPPSRWAVLTAPATSVGVSLLSFLMLLVAARDGQLDQIAAFTAGSGAAAIVVVVLAGGTTAGYLTGTPEVRAAVRRIRTAVVLPALLVGAGLIALVLGGATGLPTVAVLLGAVSVAANNQTELASADLQRALALGRWAAVSVGARVLGLAVLVAGADLSVAMAVAAVSCWVGTELLARRGARATPGTRAGVVGSFRLVYRPVLVGIAVMDVVIMRLPFVVAPLLAAPGAAGAYAALLSTQQSAGVVVTSGLYTGMAASAAEPGSAAVTGWVAHGRRLLLGLSWLLAVGGALGTQLVLWVLGFSAVPGAAWWWIVLVLALPLVAVNRSAQYARQAVRDYRGALAVLLVVGAGAGAVLVVAVVLGSLDVLAAALLVGELAGAVAVLRRRRRGAR